MITSQIDIRARYAETDKMGHVYHGNYVTWFEMARVHMMDEIGYPYKQLESEGFMLPVLEISARYLRPVQFDDIVTVHVIVKERPLVRIHCEYEIKRGEELLTTGMTRHAFINPQGEPVRPPKPLMELMGKFF